MHFNLGNPYILKISHKLYPGSTGGTGFAAIKITALGRPEILVSMNISKIKI